jgi:hypothetical protein
MDESGRAGLRFTTISKEARQQLDEWLGEQPVNLEKAPQLTQPC